MTLDTVPAFRPQAAARLGARHTPYAEVAVRITMHNPKRAVELTGPMPVATLLKQLGLLRESVLVIRGDTLVTGDTVVDDGDEIDIRPVISGGA